MKNVQFCTFSFSSECEKVYSVPLLSALQLSIFLGGSSVALFTSTDMYFADSVRSPFLPQHALPFIFHIPSVIIYHAT